MYVAADQAKKGVSDGGSSLQSKTVSTGFGKNGTAGKETVRLQGISRKRPVTKFVNAVCVCTNIHVEWNG